MARDGIVFERFCSAAPVCSPTRGSALTGQHPYRYGIPNANAGHMKPQEWTLAEALKTQGYLTGHFGKWHLGTLTTRIHDSIRGRPGVENHYSPPWMNGFDVVFRQRQRPPPTALDEQVGRLRTRLEELGVDGNSLSLPARLARPGSSMTSRKILEKLTTLPLRTRIG